MDKSNWAINHFSTHTTHVANLVGFKEVRARKFEIFSILFFPEDLNKKKRAMNSNYWDLRLSIDSLMCCMALYSMMYKQI